MASSLDGIAVAYAALHDTPTPGWNIRTMLMIAGAESSWRHAATNRNTNGSTDFGMWQINNHAWPELFNRFQWDSPRGNAGMASVVYQKQGIRAWVTHNTGAYLRYASYVDSFLANKPDPVQLPPDPVGGPQPSPSGNSDPSGTMRGLGNRFSQHARTMQATYNRLRGM